MTVERSFFVVLFGLLFLFTKLWIDCLIVADYAAYPRTTDVINIQNMLLRKKKRYKFGDIF